MPTDWRVWTIGMPVTALILAVALVIIARIWRGVKVKIGNNSVSTGETESEEPTHDCRQKDTIRALASMLGPIADSLIALLQASKGQINGNVDAAMDQMVGAKKDYQEFVMSKLGGD